MRCWRRSAGRRRSRSSISPAAPARRLRAISARLPTRQNWRLVDNDLGLLGSAATLGRPPDVTVAARADRSRARSRTGARRSDRPDHDLGAARSRVGGLARAAGDRSGGAPAAGLCGAQLRRPRVVRSRRAVRRGHRRGGEPASARRQGIWPGARSGRRAQRGGRSLQARRLFVRRGTVRLGVRPDRPGDPAARCCAASPMPPASSASCPATRIADWLARRLDLVAAGRSSMRVGHVDFFAMPMPIR